MELKTVKVTCQLASANPRYSWVEISHPNTQSFSGSLSQICDVQERKHKWGCCSWKWNGVFYHYHERLHSNHLHFNSLS